MDSRDRRNQHAVKKLVNDGFAVYLEGRTQRFGEEQRRVMLARGSGWNGRDYLPTLIELACRHLTRDILAFAKLYINESTRLRMACDRSADRELETVAMRLAGGTASGMHGHLDLLRRRTNRTLNPDATLSSVNYAIGAAKRLAVRRGKLMLERQRVFQGAGSPTPVGALHAASENPIGTPPQPPSQTATSMDIPQRSLQAIALDNERRAAAKTYLERALSGYLKALSSPRDVDQAKVAEIWSDYALTLYDSYAESFVGLEGRRETMFGEAGVLKGGEILESVKQAVPQVRVPRPDRWPRPNFARSSDDTPELLKVLDDVFAGAHVSFAWLLDEAWFWNEIRGRVLDRAQEWEKSSTTPNLLDAVTDLNTSLERVTEDDPNYKSWVSFCHKNHKAEARWILSNVRRAEQRKKLDPKGAIRFVLRLFGNAVAIQLKLVTDLKTAAGCEAELRILSEGSLSFLEELLKQTGSDESTITRWRSQLERKLVQRFSRAKLQALERAKTNDRFSMRQSVKVPKFAARRRKRVRENTRRKLTIARAQRQRAKTRAAWLDQKRSDEGWTSDLDIAHNRGPTYNTVRRYRSGQTSTRDPYVRGKLATAFGCKISEVPA